MSAQLEHQGELYREQLQTIKQVVRQSAADLASGIEQVTGMVDAARANLRAELGQQTALGPHLQALDAKVLELAGRIEELQKSHEFDTHGSQPCEMRGQPARTASSTTDELSSTKATFDLGGLNMGTHVQSEEAASCLGSRWSGKRQASESRLESCKSTPSSGGDGRIRHEMTIITARLDRLERQSSQELAQHTSGYGAERWHSEANNSTPARCTGPEQGEPLSGRSSTTAAPVEAEARDGSLDTTVASKYLAVLTNTPPTMASTPSLSLGGANTPLLAHKVGADAAPVSLAAERDFGKEMPAVRHIHRAAPQHLEVQLAASPTLVQSQQATPYAASARAPAAPPPIVRRFVSDGPTFRHTLPVSPTCQLMSHIDKEARLRSVSPAPQSPLVRSRGMQHVEVHVDQAGISRARSPGPDAWRTPGRPSQAPTAPSESTISNLKRALHDAMAGMQSDPVPVAGAWLRDLSPQPATASFGLPGSPMVAVYRAVSPMPAAACRTASPLPEFRAVAPMPAQSPSMAYQASSPMPSPWTGPDCHQHPAAFRPGINAA
eukprot:gnl/TRDRNA2_/TRDRNA2_82192_c1_seq1.p1 gnl/TRDRNA2_/TRDRNA2_82192_c1~~gnl/TRDRNA2_/TRDRNA2_82192_c1_seq1.p1  ORF type:complete len:631 (+),score=84.85 gnl/TRDRNA2_/TRDRNA2_82192_c1_seq1:241-1893(+)